MIHYTKDTNNIATLTLDMEGRMHNIINHQIVKSFIPVINHLQKEKAKGKLQGVIITSAKKTFLAGGDLEYLYQANSPQEIFDFAEMLQKFFTDIESPGVPVVAAINGTALGTGFELALACHYRVAIDAPSVKLGHPEVSLGLMPGSGGIIRLLWLLGLDKAFKILTEGKRLKPREALKAGIIDALASDKADMLEQAKNWLLKNKNARRPWQIADGKIADSNSSTEVAVKARFLGAQLAKNNLTNFPALQAILSTLVEGAMVDFNTACRIESRYFTNLIFKKETRNMIKSFWFDFNAIRSGVNRPKGYGRFRPKKIGIIGAGRMGSGIAFTCLCNEMEVVIKDISKSVAARAAEYVEKQLALLVKKKTITAAQSKTFFSRMQTTDDAASFADCDLVVEAVFENKMVKIKVTREAENYMDEYAIFGTNTVSIPITELGEKVIRPANLVGLHFFSPVEEVPIVEIVKGKQTSDETIARAFDFVRKIKKIPIVIKDNWGFYCSRVQNTFILEGIQMLQEGYPPALVENISIQAGMPKGALALADSLSLELVLHYEDQAAKHYGKKYISHPATELLRVMIEDFKRNGKTKKAGFYEYADDGTRLQLWTEFNAHFPSNLTDFSIETLKERFLFVQVLEAIWCLQEGIIASIPEANLGSIHGWGFPAFKGGVIRYVNDYGVTDFVEKCKIYEKIHGPHYQVPKMLLEMAKANTVFV